ncbi:hypothetical protein [Aureibacter tunicatorum]|uniref:Uncharacterized protein n=1 Tax=Aureibacter tunicatorum TaxID=866807 RepID=A0AAE4BR18_9BACT|nr:hypothetical protein [Aureibacter tunicatorum]MDR6237478.1 hypothetical protein [Aureibacter tunicatorum]BDD06467.1 hypothetical protein AUTU_39500 [Aureibacter tunicatorum]
MVVIEQKEILDIQASFQSSDLTAVEEMMSKFSEEQPFVLGYVFVVSENKAEELKQMGVFINTLIWNAFKSKVGEFPLITEEDLLESAMACEKEAKELNEKRQGMTEEQLRAQAVELLESRRQKHLYDFVYSFIENEMRQDDYEGMGTLSSMGQIVIEAFDKKING